MRRRFLNNSIAKEDNIVQIEHSMTYTFPFDCFADLFLVGGAVEALLIIAAIMGMADAAGLPGQY